MNITEQYVAVVLLIVPHKEALTFESVNKILQCGSSGEIC